MAEAIQTHQTSITMIQSIPAEVDAGTVAVLKVNVSCARGCDLQGRPVKLMAPDGVVVVTELVRGDEHVNEAEVIFHVPAQMAEYQWSLSFPRHDAGNIVHEESSVPIVFNTKSHKTSMAVWDIPLPVTMDGLFKVKVGVKCSVQCQLTDQLIEVRDEAGNPVGVGRLGETPWPQTTGLHWSEIEVAAPSTEGVFHRTVHFSSPELKLPHESSSAAFTFRKAKSPEHTVTVEIVDTDTHAPLQNADVQMNVYKGMSGENGVAKVDVPKGTYELAVSVNDYYPYLTSVDVADNVSMKIELKTIPPVIG